jgi:hypothetical protein
MTIMGVVMCAGFLTPEQPKDKREQGRQQDACAQRKVKTEIISLYEDVTRQFAHPGDARGKGYDDSDSYKDKSQDDQWTSQAIHKGLSFGR